MLKSRSVMAILATAVFVSSQQARAQTPAMTGKLLDIGGRRLHVDCRGNAQPTVIIENGGGAFSVDWALVQPAVSEFTRICTYDRAGYAWSDPGPVRDLPEQIIADFQLLLRKLAMDSSVVLVGQSIGGILIRDYQRRFSERVVGMVLVDPTHDEGLAYIINGKPKAISVVSRGELVEFMRDWLSRPHAAPAVPQVVTPPFDRLPANLQPARLWAEAQYAADWDVNRTPYIGEGQRQEFIALRDQRLAKDFPLGNLPLVVLTNGRNEQKAGLISLSAVGTLIVADNSCHEIQLCSPELVIQAIRAVVDRVRRSSK